MKIILFSIGKTTNPRIAELVTDYHTKIQHYNKLDLIELPALKNTKNMDESKQKEEEGKKLLACLNPGDTLVLLDENGKEYTSQQFSIFLQKKMNSGIKNLVIAIGGPYGFSQEVRAEANGLVSLSKMTFTHQMVRIFALEQIYRGFTILKGEPYHHR